MRCRDCNEIKGPCDNCIWPLAVKEMRDRIDLLNEALSHYGDIVNECVLTLRCCEGSGLSSKTILHTLEMAIEQRDRAKATWEKAMEDNNSVKVPK